MSLTRHTSDSDNNTIIMTGPSVQYSCLHSIVHFHTPGHQSPTPSSCTAVCSCLSLSLGSPACSSKCCRESMDCRLPLGAAVQSSGCDQPRSAHCTAAAASLLGRPAALYRLTWGRHRRTAPRRLVLILNHRCRHFSSRAFIRSGKKEI